MEKFIEIKGGVTAPLGYTAAGVHVGVKAANKTKRDIAVIFSEVPCVAAGKFTTNQVKAAPVKVSQKNIRNRQTYAIVANSGNANACTGIQGVLDAKRMTAIASKELGVKDSEILICSTGRIGVPMPMSKISDGIQKAVKKLSRNGSKDAAEAIMTSDSYRKEAAISLRINGRRVTIGAIAKGAGMIDPNMATMLCFVTTDALIDKKSLDKALGIAVEQSFNSITVDGDMSTNDTVLMLANGLAENETLIPSHPEFHKFQAALNAITRKLALMIVDDGEGTTKTVEVVVKGASNQQDARTAAGKIANSVLVKCAWCGGDPNWGRVMDAIGYSSARIKEECVDIYYDGLCAVRNGIAARTPTEKLRKIVKKNRFTLTVHLNLGAGEHTVFASDLTEKYVELNKSE
ncbi:bifunctional glutamate N-acetyltransferase/amino-acid acetyltransferase ArgJ [Oscillatoria amoena NRMC-F 0135]|nr:bifunctional glutamate N-acetyltransferase/amino-acid acetyltransferase ArgJ [Oscillatoria amoena NRMC-F 0135]